MTTLAALAAGVAFLADPALAGDLKAPFELESAKVLPRGVRNPRFKNLEMWVDSRWDDAGLAQPLGARLNKTVSWSEVLAKLPTETDRNLARAVLASVDASEAGGPGATTGEVNVYASVKVPVLAVGVTDRLTLAAAVPVLTIDTKAQTGFVQSQDGQKFISALAARNPVKAQETAAKLNGAIEQKLASLGYEPIGPRSFTALGDIKLVGKYLLAERERGRIALKGEVTLPTGVAPNADRALDLPTGDGQWDVGAGVVYEQKLLPRHELWINVYGGYTVQLPDQLDRRLPASETDSLSADKERVKRDLGDLIAAGTGVSYTLTKVGVNLGVGYHFQYLTGTSYAGTQYPSFRYRLLERESPSQLLHSATVAAGFSTVDWYREKRFPLPFQANVGYGRPLGGRSTTTNDVVSGELVLFF